ncbi:MAG TPA: Crp/Fnr family transcriptional regulator [Bacillales bacterium]|nr:Crp/Fnr family transcriptional regulator [Bacillales bacterium]
MTEMSDLLRRIPLFSELNEYELQHICSITTTRVYPKRQYIFMEGEQREAVFFIQSGAVKTFKIDESGHEQVINILDKDEMFPHIGFFETNPYPATAEAIEKTELLIIRIDDFDNLLTQHPVIALKVMKIMGQKILMLQQRIQELISQDVEHRLVRVLIRLARESGRKEGNGVHIHMPITNQDLANMVGSTRETVNRLLNSYKKANLLEATRQGISIHDVDRLKQYLVE